MIIRSQEADIIKLYFVNLIRSLAIFILSDRKNDIIFQLVYFSRDIFFQMGMPKIK